jgi:hypothetical protein
MKNKKQGSWCFRGKVWRVRQALKYNNHKEFLEFVGRLYRDEKKSAMEVATTLAESSKEKISERTVLRLLEDAGVKRRAKAQALTLVGNKKRAVKADAVCSLCGKTAVEGSLFIDNCKIETLCEGCYYKRKREESERAYKKARLSLFDSYGKGQLLVGKILGRETNNKEEEVAVLDKFYKERYEKMVPPRKVALEIEEITGLKITVGAVRKRYQAIKINQQNYGDRQTSKK